MDSHWLAWAAGFIDGEGSIAVYKRNRRDRWKDHALRISVVNTDPRPLKELQRLFGGSIQWCHKPGPKHPNWKPSWAWVGSHRVAESCLVRIIPWLVAKREQAELAILSRRLVSSKGRRKTPSELEQYEWLARRLVELKEQPLDHAGTLGQKNHPGGNQEILL